MLAVCDPFFRGSKLRRNDKSNTGKDTEQAFHYAHTLKGVCANLTLWRMQDAVSGVVEGLRMGKLPREEEISDLEKCYQKTVVWVNLVKEQGITDF